MCDGNTIICDDKLDDLLNNELITDGVPTEQHEWDITGKCAVVTCKNTCAQYGDTLTFYSFPSNAELRNVWFDVCDINISNVDVRSLKICEIHFTTEDFEQILDRNYTKVLKSNAVPSISVPVIETPPYEVVKEYVDTNDSLQNRLDELSKEQEKATKELDLYNKHLRIYQRKCGVLKNKITKLKTNSIIIRNEKNLLSKVFSDAQVKILMGKKKVIWTDDDLAMAFSLRQMSSKECYLYLKTFLNMPLPALSSVQKWAASI